MLRIIPVILALAFFATGRAEDEIKTTTVTTTKTANIMDTLKADGRFRVLVGALEDTKLAETLRAAGPFTLFAPTDDAFRKLPNLHDTTSDATHMKALLNNHLSSKNVTLADMAKMPAVTMINGEAMTVATNGKTIGTAAIVIPDVIASNGVIHGIDRVLTQSVEKKKESAVQTPPPANAYVQNTPPPAEPVPGPEFRIATQERVRPDGTIERKEVPVAVTPPAAEPPPAQTVVVQQPQTIERKVVIEESVAPDGTIVKREVVVEERPREVNVGGELKRGVDKTYDGLKTGAGKVKRFFTGN